MSATFLTPTELRYLEDGVLPGKSPGRRYNFQSLLRKKIAEESYDFIKNALHQMILVRWHAGSEEFWTKEYHWVRRERPIIDITPEMELLIEFLMAYLSEEEIRILINDLDNALREGRNWDSNREKP